MLPSEVLDAHSDLHMRLEDPDFRQLVWRFGGTDTNPNGAEEEIRTQARSRAPKTSHWSSPRSSWT